MIAQILIYVKDHWSEDFEEFLEEIPDALEVARALNDNPTSAVTASQLNLIEMTFGEFISGGGFPRGTRFSSLEEFIEEMDEG
ncbi:hypothetical protein [Aurantimicrobium minutum]|uniref:Helicase conserved C-terminal domain protein n=1 Tax=Aurantimicrobium minutum TaxID=708131 RepID=A0A173LXV9_9MICO|nr:hypothetical protein [Aurantimicrobium minutum]BAU99688.1 Helicase conserved C-terminal domain protein [Aurantimicrobium minutum]